MIAVQMRAAISSAPSEPLPTAAGRREVVRVPLAAAGIALVRPDTGWRSHGIQAITPTQSMRLLRGTHRMCGRSTRLPIAGSSTVDSMPRQWDTSIVHCDLDKMYAKIVY